MSISAKVQQAALTLLDQYHHKQNYTLEDRLMPTDLDEAYLIQREFQSHVSEEQGAIAGYKLAYTTTSLQESVGVSDPVLGIMLENNIRHSPSRLKASDFLQLALECEVGVRLGSDLSPGGAPYDRGAVSEAVESLMPAFEVVDIRRTQGVHPMIGFITGVSANIFNAGVVLGTPVTNWRELDLAAAYGSMTINEKIVGDGHGADVMGHPLEPLAWLANKLAEQGFGLSAGMVVITGSIVTPKVVKPGDTASISIEGLGSAKLEVV